ncbi:dienelactone hydrolase family protein [Pseudanabaena sp. FACHB-2040]|uniref:dienelactone hydrolase family protein n=1 Tax=Pseudanabaena sp. FACHB-2040 TaxID=2692859 RepID=UPI0016843260|nr:dienelactone hydrolase family protein [Pseudanabaena sp. FACHB-2040]MBD2260286.1 dienelactone hydrolase family protein [Pseudanabaena sp. FACHB-2040]
MTTSLPIRTATIEIISNHTPILAYLAEPGGEGPFPAVVVIQEVFGVNAHIRSVTDRFAEAGYVAIAPHIYYRQAPGFEVGYSQADLELGRKYKVGTQADELLSDIQAAVDLLHSKATVKPDGVGCIGFCFGGHVAYLAATLPAIKATAVFYGAGITSLTPGGGEPTLTRTQAIAGTVYGFFGNEDPLIPLKEVDQIKAELAKHSVPHQVFLYEGVGHGFFCDQRDSYHSQAAGDAWQQVMQLFKETL